MHAALRRGPARGVTLWTASLCLASLGTLIAAGAGAELPPENQCPTYSGSPGSGPKQDAAPVRLREGMLLDYGDILQLGSLLPIEVWRNRDAFFHEGMRLEVGPCHRRYPAPGFFGEATRKFAGQARIDADGDLEDAPAGLPFPPDGIDPEADDAALRWAWNLERRYRGAGPAGKFRIVDMPSRVGGIQTYEGSWFFLQTAHRADLADSDYRVGNASGSSWIAGGRFSEPSSARHLAWRQLRPLSVDTQFSESDDTFVYVPTMRKVRRAASTWVDGLYTPRYRVSGDSGGGGLPVGGSDFGVGGSINPSSSESAAATENLRRGFEGLALRPNAYHWRLREMREVLAPINVTRVGYPEEPDRNFGPSGLSVGSDRWDVRYAVVIQGAVKEPGRDFDLLTVYVDYQTQQPLYVITKRRRGARLVEVGILLHRFSGDLIQYPTWPGDGQPALVFDPVAAVFFDVADGGSGWRRESYDVVSIPPSDEDIEQLMSTSYLTRGR